MAQRPVHVDDAKLGGCLVELGGAAEGPCRAVIGIGINLFRTPAMDDLDQASTALEDHGWRSDATPWPPN